MTPRQIAIQSIRNAKGAIEIQLREKRELETLVADLTYKNEQLALARNITEAIIKFCDSGVQSYKKEKLEELSLDTEEILSTIFPGEDFSVVLSPSMFRNEPVTTLLIGQDGEFAEMKDQNGRMCRQCTSFKINTKIQEICNAVPVLMDEAFNSGDAETVQHMGAELGKMIQRGVQIILTEHQRDLYKDLPRLQVNLVKDSILRKVTEVNVETHGDIL